MCYIKPKSSLKLNCVTLVNICRCNEFCLFIESSWKEIKCNKQSVHRTVALCTQSTLYTLCKEKHNFPGAYPTDLQFASAKNMIAINVSQILVWLGISLPRDCERPRVHRYRCLTRISKDIGFPRTFLDTQLTWIFTRQTGMLKYAMNVYCNWKIRYDFTMSYRLGNRY